ncbi:fumarate reductase flavoprotein subunit [Geopseudomonas sagittaria]|uniref:Fumarate reductase flavoprotein subunit n=1 Tax=Geopseudomonas sagittaria TaxID=1135990 RepID=A0A1I5R4Z9_9GAMM|nr:FAD-dependent oxidoreductase [Pseudomonas sagittaria]SFP53583.1 fumarate reductase flavoprotein subunit [Pseudomonas sagittaria]
MSEILNTQLLVIGGGLAGFAAALSAAEAGLDVLLLEKTAATGGSSAMSGGCLAFAGTDLQNERGIEDSSALLLRDLIEVGKGECDEEIVRAYTDHQLATYEWLKAHGVVFQPVIETASGQSVPRVHNVDPADMVRQLELVALNTGKVEVLRNTRARRLLRSAGGRVVGASAERDGLPLEVRAARGVILACGGFVHDRELIHRFAPLYDNAVFIGGEGNQGDGLRMAWALGADVRDMVHIKGTFGKHPMDENNHHACLAVYKGAIAVNQEGRRYVDESLSYKLLGDACMQQSYGVTYQILDRDIMESGDDRVRILDFERRLEEGLFVEADSLEQLAKLLELPVDDFLAEVAAYNAAVSQGEPPAFGRRHLVHQHGALRTIARPPFYAYPSSAAVFGTYCGVKVDAQMRVHDVFGAPIDGLLAAGEMVGGLHGAAYMTGSALGKAAIFGRLAATTACNG